MLSDQSKRKSLTNQAFKCRFIPRRAGYIAHTQLITGVVGTEEGDITDIANIAYISNINVNQDHLPPRHIFGPSKTIPGNIIEILNEWHKKYPEAKPECSYRNRATKRQSKVFDRTENNLFPSIFQIRKPVLYAIIFFSMAAMDQGSWLQVLLLLCRVHFSLDGMDLKSSESKSDEPPIETHSVKKLKPNPLPFPTTVSPNEQTPRRGIQTRLRTITRNPVASPSQNAKLDGIYSPRGEYSSGFLMINCKCAFSRAEYLRGRSGGICLMRVRVNSICLFRT